MMKAFVPAILLLISAATAYGESAPLVPSDFVGVWKLVKSENPMPDGSLVTYCNGVHGYIIYTAEGYVSVSLNCGPKVSDNEPADISGRKFFYTGTFTLEGNVVTHHLENASDVQLIGTDSVRTAGLIGSVLVLTGVNQGQTFSAYWQKVK
jgi:hypothetical protein